MTLISPYFPLLFPLTVSFFLSFLLPTMINLLNKNIIHSFLAFVSQNTTTEFKLQIQSHQPIIATATGGANMTPKDPFIDAMGGGVDGLMCCTESLGFESSDERGVDDQTHQINDDKRVNDEDDDAWRRRRMMSAEGRRSWRKVRSFPPPLTSLNRNGKPSFFLRPVRKDGRLELTEVRIHRPEILHASRHDGRLTLHLIPDQSILEEEEQEELVEEEETARAPREELEVEEEEEDVRYGKKEERVGEWRFPNEEFRRCHQMVNQHHHIHHVPGTHHHHLRMCGIGIV